MGSDILKFKPKTKPSPPAPKGLCPEAKKFWREINAGWCLDEAAAELLKVACLSLSRFYEAQEIVTREGCCFRTATGEIRRHPACEVEKTSRAGFQSALKDLGLESDDLKTTGKVGRPISKTVS